MWRGASGLGRSGIGPEEGGGGEPDEGTAAARRAERKEGEGTSMYVASDDEVFEVGSGEELEEEQEWPEEEEQELFEEEEQELFVEESEQRPKRQKTSDAEHNDGTTH
mgnify:CR=1 FL=1